MNYKINTTERKIFFIKITTERKFFFAKITTERKILPISTKNSFFSKKISFPLDFVKNLPYIC